MTQQDPSADEYYAINTAATEWEASYNPKLGVDLGRLMLRKDTQLRASCCLIWRGTR